MPVAASSNRGTTTTLFCADATETGIKKILKNKIQNRFLNATFFTSIGVFGALRIWEIIDIWTRPNLIQNNKDTSTLLRNKPKYSLNPFLTANNQVGISFNWNF